MQRIGGEGSGRGEVEEEEEEEAMKGMGEGWKEIGGRGDN